MASRDIRNSLRIRTWPVFLLGMGSMLALSVLPSLLVLRRTAEVFPEIRRIQDQQRLTQTLIAKVERETYSISITMREFLLDNSPALNNHYQAEFVRLRGELLSALAHLREVSALKGNPTLAALDREVLSYLEGVEPVFSWSNSQRASRGLYFLRQEQRTRSRSVVDIAERVSQLTKTAYARQLGGLNDAQVDFASDTEHVIAIAFLVGGMISILTVARLVVLEERAGQQRARMAQAEQELRALSTRLMEAQEQERKSISRELHDEVGQLLTGLRMSLGGLARSRADESQFESHLSESKSLAEQALRSIRDLAVGLRPSVLDLGLVPAIRYQARRFSSYSGLPVRVQTGEDLAELPEEHRICLYRVVQECLTNAAKHASARSIHIELRQRDGMMEVVVRDDGVGFARLPGAQGGIGLIGMEERVRDLQGTLSVHTAAAAGTRVEVRLPVPPREEHA
ncbi:MAG: sensor histidine kinase [Bryobacterales bacterium]|nr:sensor histidine kinase [Bryobacterales bacterium]